MLINERGGARHSTTGGSRLCSHLQNSHTHTHTREGERESTRERELESKRERKPMHHSPSMCMCFYQIAWLFLIWFKNSQVYLKQQTIVTKNMSSDTAKQRKAIHTAVKSTPLISMIYLAPTVIQQRKVPATWETLGGAQQPSNRQQRIQMPGESGTQLSYLGLPVRQINAKFKSTHTTWTHTHTQQKQHSTTITSCDPF